MSGPVLAGLPSILACSVCFQDQPEPLVDGARIGVIFIIAVIIPILLAIIGIGFYWGRRAAMLEANEAFEQKPAAKLFG